MPPPSEPGVARVEVEEAAARIDGRVRETPVLELEPQALGSAEPVSLKLELLQRTGSFKLRGALSALRAIAAPRAGVVAASGGNFGVAVAVAARELGIPATIFVPEASPPAKVDLLREEATEVVVVGAYYDDALVASRERAAQTGCARVASLRRSPDRRRAGHLRAGARSPATRARPVSYTHLTLPTN